MQAFPHARARKSAHHVTRLGPPEPVLLLVQSVMALAYGVPLHMAVDDVRRQQRFYTGKVLEYSPEALPQDFALPSPCSLPSFLHMEMEIFRKEHGIHW